MARYDLDEATVRERTATALAAHPSTGRYAALALKPDDPMADVARGVEREVFAETFDMDAVTMATEYGPYESASLFFLVLDRRTGMPAGAGRVIDGGGKTLDDAPDACGRKLSEIVTAHGMYDGKIWDFATAAVLPAHRGGRSGPAVSSLLYRTFLAAGRRAKVRHVVCMLDHRAHRNMELLGVRFVPMAGSTAFAYLGSPSTMALYHPFTDLEPSIAAQSAKLRDLRSPHAGRIAARGLKRLLTRRTAARVAEQISSGTGLDDQIALVGLERRRFAHRR